MKDELIFRKKFLSLLSLLLLGLFAVSLYLYSDNKAFKQKNEKLILENDSLISANMRLRIDINKVEQPRYTQRKNSHLPGNYK